LRSTETPAVRDPHTVLGVAADADRKTIKRAFRALAREHHPDLSGAPGAEERFRELVEAYQRLAGSPRHRREPRYDVSGIVSFYAWLAGKRAAERARPSPLVAELELRPAEAARGGLCAATLESANGRQRIVEVNVPPHARNGERLTVPGEEGEPPVEVVLRVVSRRGEGRALRLAAALALAYAVVLFAVIVARATG
jgi:DnaJ-class molecular chaperone